MWKLQMPPGPAAKALLLHTGHIHESELVFPSGSCSTQTALLSVQINTMPALARQSILVDTVGNTYNSSGSCFGYSIKQFCSTCLSIVCSAVR